jgi:hypothetical protein
VLVSDLNVYTFIYMCVCCSTTICVITIDGDNFLTHKGQALRGDADYAGAVVNDPDADDDANLNAEMVDRLHFGK